MGGRGEGGVLIVMHGRSVETINHHISLHCRDGARRGWAVGGKSRYGQRRKGSAVKVGLAAAVAAVGYGGGHCCCGYVR